MKVRLLSNQITNRQRWLRKPLANRRSRHWLTGAASLTARLKARYADFYVEPLAVVEACVASDEAACLMLSHREEALVREVLLYGHQQPVVFAHSVLPKKSLRGDWHGLGKLGNKPLGEALFKNPKVERTPLQFKKLPSHHTLYKKAAQHIDNAPTFLWARRSIFSLHCAHILVTEVFLPHIHDSI